MLHSSKEPIVISGMGMVSPFGMGIELFTDALQNSKSAVDFIDKDLHKTLPINVGAYIQNFNFPALLKQVTTTDNYNILALRLGMRAPISIQASILAALETWHDACYPENYYAPQRIGLIAAGNNTTTALSYALHSKNLENAHYLTPTYALNFLDTNHIGYLSELFRIQGDSAVIGGASASGNLALIHAMRLIQWGIVDCCMVIGIMAELSPLELQAMRNLNVLGGIKFANDPKKASRPFDRQHEGFIPGQACAGLFLEKEVHANQRGSVIRGKMISGYSHLDACHLTEPNSNGEINAMRLAIEAAELSINDIGYVNAHGTSSVLGDEIEASAIQEVFGKNVWVNSTKSLIGHCLWSAGVVETIATLLQLNNNFLHENYNLVEPISEQCKWVTSMLKNIRLDYALSNSFAFGGINSSIVLQRS